MEIIDSSCLFAITVGFTPEVSEMKTNLKTLYASGGGDGPEAVTAALFALTEMVCSSSHHGFSLQRQTDRRIPIFLRNGGKGRHAWRSSLLMLLLME